MHCNGQESLSDISAQVNNNMFRELGEQKHFSCKQQNAKLLALRVCQKDYFAKDYT